MRLPQLRLVWYAFFAGLGLMAGLVVFLTDDGEGAPSIMVLVVVLVAAVDMGAMLWFRRMGDTALLTAESNEELRLIYTRRFVLAGTMALSPSVIGCAIALAIGNVTPFVLGSAVSLPALVYVGPRAGDVRAGDDALRNGARPFRLSAALGA